MHEIDFLRLKEALNSIINEKLKEVEEINDTALKLQMQELALLLAKQKATLANQADVQADQHTMSHGLRQYQWKH